MATYNNIHRQQLFHWIGSHIDARVDRTRGKLDDSLRAEYVTCLRGALMRGLWVKTPRDPDYLGKGDLIKVTRPITCFTEWTLGQSLPHTTRYGRLGLGFPKRYVLARGGQPVTYVRDSIRNDPYTAALKALAKHFKDATAEANIATSKLTELQECFDYLSHFNKRIKRPALPSPVGKQAAATTARVSKPVQVPDPFVRRFGTTLHYLEEREWRIVYSPSLRDYFTEGGRANQPDFHLPFIPGRELFTVVLPDNQTVNMALNDRRISKQLYPSDAPHVTVLSLQDIGTF
jgi:hypothetical protein